jgi:hypothetical protein
MFPKPPGWGWVFSTQLEEYLNWLYKNNPKSELITNLTDAFVSEYVPSIIPNAGQGFAAWGMGYDWFRGIDIVPEGEKRLPPFLQASQFNSETAKWLAYNLRQLPNWKALDLAKSPRMFEGVGKVQFGGTFRTGLDIADTIGYTTKRAGLGSSEYFDKLPSMGKMPIVRSVISSPRYRSSSLASDFYDKLAEINMVYNEDKLLGRQGRVNVRRDERERNSKLLRNYWLFNSVSRLVTDKNFEFKKVELDEKMDDKIKEAKLIRLGNEIDGLYKKALDKIRE